MSERSYYEEALEILRSKQVLNHETKLNEQTVPESNGNDKEDFEITAKRQNNSSSFNNYLAKPSNNLENLNGFFLQRENNLMINNSSKLPRLPTKIFEENENICEENLSRVSSASSTKSSTVFPKIDSRFLPK